MAHNVKCLICGQTFDTEIYEAVRLKKSLKTHTSFKSVRYVHKTCKELHPEISDDHFESEVTVLKEDLKEKNKNLILNKKQEEITVNMQTGAITAKPKHTENTERLEKEQKEKEDFERLKDTIRDIFGNSVDWSRTIIQIKSLKEKRGYSYSGMMRSLIYYYQKLGNEPQRTYGSAVSIVPYVYEKAYNYYYNIWLLQQRNKQENLEYKANPTQEIRNITIKEPERTPIKIEMRKPLFGFLEEDNIGEN